MSDSRNIYAPNLDLENLAYALIAWYRTEQYSIERSTTGKGMDVLKCRRAKENGKKRPSLLVTLRQQDAGLAADVEVFKANKGWLIVAMIVAPIVGLLSLTGGNLWRYRVIVRDSFLYLLRFQFGARY